MPLLERPRMSLLRTNAVRSAELGELVVLGQGRWRPSLARRNGMLVLVVHGPRGSGASTVAANLAIALTQYGTRVVILDLDVERPTQHKLFGIPSPVAGLRALVQGSVETVGEVLNPTELKNLFLVSSLHMDREALAWSPEVQQNILAQLAELDTDILIVDSGNPTAPTLGFFGQNEVGHLFVCPPDTDDLSRIETFVASHVGVLLAEESLDEPTPSWDLQSILASASPPVRERVVERLQTFCFGLIGNRMREERQVGVVHAASRWFAHHWGVRVPVLGVLTESPRFVGGTEDRPFLLSARHDRNSRAVHVMAEILLAEATSALLFPRDASREDGFVRACTIPGSGPARFPTRDERDAPRRSLSPSALEPYMRRSPRFEVDWYGTLRLSTDTRATAVRIFEISEIGAAVETVASMDEGTGGELRLDQVRGAPTLPVRVQRLHPGLNRAGLSFEEAPASLRHALVAIARAQQP